MANKDQSRGFEPWGELLRANEYVTSAIVYPGDMVKMGNDGKVAPCAASDSSVGVALCYAASGANVLIADDPQQLFIGQADDATIDAQTDLGLNYNITVGTASTLYKRSAMEVDASTQATDSTLPLRVIRINRAIDNALGDQVDVVVQINKHQLAANSEGL